MFGVVRDAAAVVHAVRCGTSTAELLSSIPRRMLSQLARRTAPHFVLCSCVLLCTLAWPCLAWLRKRHCRSVHRPATEPPALPSLHLQVLVKMQNEAFAVGGLRRCFRAKVCFRRGDAHCSPLAHKKKAHPIVLPWQVSARSDCRGRGDAHWMHQGGRIPTWIARLAR